MPPPVREGTERHAVQVFFRESPEAGKVHSDSKVAISPCNGEWIFASVNSSECRFTSAARSIRPPSVLAATPRARPTAAAVTCNSRLFISISHVSLILLLAGGSRRREGHTSPPPPNSPPSTALRLPEPACKLVCRPPHLLCSLSAVRRRGFLTGIR